MASAALTALKGMEADPIRATFGKDNTQLETDLAPSSYEALPVEEQRRFAIAPFLRHEPSAHEQNVQSPTSPAIVDNRPTFGATPSAYQPRHHRLLTTALVISANLVQVRDPVDYNASEE